MVDAAAGGGALKVAGVEAEWRHHVESGDVAAARRSFGLGADLAAGRCAARGRLCAEVRLVVEELHRLSVEPSVGESHFRAALRVVIHGPRQIGCGGGRSVGAGGEKHRRERKWYESSQLHRLHPLVGKSAGDARDTSREVDWIYRILRLVAFRAV